MKCRAARLRAMADEDREMLCREYGYTESFARVRFSGTTPGEVDAAHATWPLYKASTAADKR